MSKSSYIYALCEPDTGEVRYVGKAVDVKRRFTVHLSSSRGGSDTNEKAAWIESLRLRGSVPVVKVLEETNGSGWKDAERKWIAFYRSSGAALTNATDGGEGREYPERDPQQLTHVLVSDWFINRLDNFRFAHRFESRAAAVRWLIEWALAQNPTPQR